MNELNVLYASDNNYAPYMGISIYSLLENNKSIDRIRFFCVLDKVSEENTRRLMQMVNSYNRELICIDAARVYSLMEELGVPKYRGSYATHYRKFFHLFIPEDVERLLYIDSDSIITGDLSELCTFDFHGKCLGVVWDTLGLKYKKKIGFSEEEIYFNAGVTYIDVRAWKERDYSNKLIRHINTVRARYCNPDQDLFNIVLKNDTILLPIEYNFQPAHRVYSDKIFFKCNTTKYYNAEEIKYARKNPKILHTYRFLGEFPWHMGNLHPDNDVFNEYLAKSPWNDYVKKPASVGLLLKTEKLIYRILPRDLFFCFFDKLLLISFSLKNNRLKKQNKKL